MDGKLSHPNASRLAILQPGSQNTSEDHGHDHGPESPWHEYGESPLCGKWLFIPAELAALATHHIQLTEIVS